MGFLTKIFGTHSERELKLVIPIVDDIEALESTIEKLSDEELRGKTNEFKNRLKNGETVHDNVSFLILSSLLL
jgi:preprotein translocase subunit SecA